MNNSRHFAIVAVLIVITTVVLYIFFSAIFALPQAASAEAAPIDIMFDVHYWMIAFLFALIMVIMLYSAVVFRREPDDDEDGPHIHGVTSLEIGWTVIPTIIVLGFGVYGTVVLNDIVAPNQGEVTIKVEGKQWGWRFEYPEEEDAVSGQLGLEVGRPVLLEMTAPDVLHSFWVSEFRVKQDLVPGRTTYLRFTPTEPGTYKVRCAEICGTGHADMRATVLVMDSADYDAWVEDIQSVPDYANMTPEERGAEWYNDPTYNCFTCHSPDGAALAGPTWQGIIGREEALADGSTVIVDADYIESSILEPNAQIVDGFQPGVMPENFAELIAETEQNILDTQGIEVDVIDDLIAFMATLE